MTTFREWPSDGGPHTADSIGQALSGMVARDSSGNPVPGMVAPPTVSAVGGAWKVKVSRFVYVRNVAGSARFSGLSASEQHDIANAASIPAGQARIDRVCWNPVIGELVVLPGTPGVSPVAPGAGSLASVATVRVQAGDSQVVAARVLPDFVLSGLAVPTPVSGRVAPVLVFAGGAREFPIVFPAGAFDVAPMVFVTAVCAASDVSATVHSVTAAGCVVRVGATGVWDRNIGANWRAEAE